MDMIRYFAYGSNMLAQQLQARCKSARTTGVARVTGYRLAFSKSSKDGSGKATLVADAAEQVFGVVFDIGNEDVSELDRIEGRGKGYERIEMAAQTLPDGRPMTVTTYIAQLDSLDAALCPYDWYLQLVLRGADQNRLPDYYLTRLSALRAIADPCLTRRTRLEALAILAGLEPSR